MSSVVPAAKNVSTALVHPEPQLIAVESRPLTVALPVTLPLYLPGPVRLTVRVLVGVGTNFTFTELFSVIVKVQVAPEQALALPVPPSKTAASEPLAGAVLTVTTVPVLTAELAFEQLASQLMPVAIALPKPEPAFSTVSDGVAMKVGFTVFAALSVTLQVSPARSGQPYQLEKTQPAAGLAVRVTSSFSSKSASHSEPHSIPAGFETTV